MQQRWKALQSTAPTPLGIDLEESLRGRRRRELRQLLSDAATQMFLAHGFDAVRVVDVARACGVTEKTVYNHFATKEALLADRWEEMTSELAIRLPTEQATPVQVVLGVLARELDALLPDGEDADGGARLADSDRFLALVSSTPALRAHEREALGNLVAVAASALAERRWGLSERSPSPQDWVVASALVGLWVVFSRSLTASLERHRGSTDAASVRSQVLADLRCAATTLEQGL